MHICHCCNILMSMLFILHGFSNWYIICVVIIPTWKDIFWKRAFHVYISKLAKALWRNLLNKLHQTEMNSSCVFKRKRQKTFHGTKDNNFTISYFGLFSLAKIAFMIECISCVVFKDCCRSSQFWQHIIYYLTKHGNTFVCIVQLNVQIIGRRLFIALNKCECLLVLMLWLLKAYRSIP